MKYFAIIAMMLLAACQPPQEANYEPVPVAPPGSPQKPQDPVESPLSQEEQDFFAKEQSEVERIFLRLGYKESLKKIPIILTGKDEGEKWGVCVREDMTTPEGPYKEPQIRISGKNMATDLKNKNVQSGRYMSITRITLLHVLGHCYFKKQHNQKVLSGQNLRMVVDGISRKFVPQSAMNTEYDMTQMPKALTQYYVGELMGRWRANNLNELAVRVPGAKVVNDLQATE